MTINWDAVVLGPCEAVFGEPAVLMPAAGGSFAITGVFDSAYKDVALIDAGLDANTVQPVIGVRSALLVSQPVPGDMVYVASASTTFLIRDVRPDGHGWVKLMLADTAEPATYTHAYGSPYPVRVVFNANIDPILLSGIPTVILPTASLRASPVVGDQIQIPRMIQSYYVTAVLSQLNGMTKLQMAPL